MLIISVGEGENIDKAVKRYKRKFESVKMLRHLRKRQHFTKPSVARREQIKKACYIQRLKTNEEL